MGNNQYEAIEILKEVLKDLFKGSPDVISLLRRCAHICVILNWQEQLVRFRNELDGYSTDSELPIYRKSVRGYTKWNYTGGIYTILAGVVQDQYSTSKEPIASVVMNVLGNIDWILAASQTGYIESTGEKSTKFIRHSKENVETEKINVYDKQVFQDIIKNIENEVFKFASVSYSALNYGDSLQDIWQSYRAIVEERLIPIGFSKHFDSIRNGLTSDNPQEWRKTMWSCRDMLCDLATYLWQDKRETYEYLPGKDGKLQVTASHYVNRLAAYLHQKGVKGKTGDYLRSEIERIFQSIKTLNEFDSKAHTKINIQDSRTAAIGTYILIGEIALRTDLKPVHKYYDPEN